MEKARYKEKYREHTRHKHTFLEIILVGTEGAMGYPRARICVNNKIYFDDDVEGVRTIEFKVNEIQHRNLLSIEMTNKSHKDTIVSGNMIVKDKFLEIQKICLDNVDIKNYIFKGRQQPIYHHDGQGPKRTVSEKLFFNGKWKLYYENPARIFLAKYRGAGQMINSPEKQAQKNKYLHDLKEIMKDNGAHL